MAIVKYVKKESNLGIHTVFAQAVSFSTLTFDDLAEEIMESTGIDSSVVRVVLDRYVKVATRNVLRGHRVKMGDLLTMYPQISCSVKDEVDENGNVTKVATPDMLNIARAKSSIGATISQSVSEKFRSSVSWKLATAKDDGDTTPTTDPTDPATTGGTTQQPAKSGPVLTISKQGTGQAAVTDQTGQPVSSGATLTAGQTLTLTVTPAAGKTPTATLGTQTLTLTEDEGQYTVTFQMPSESATLTVVTSPGDNEGD